MCFQLLGKGAVTSKISPILVPEFSKTYIQLTKCVPPKSHNPNVTVFGSGAFGRR
jgi:hypothetical protein